MLYLTVAPALAALSWLVAVAAQAPGPANNNPGCETASDATEGGTYYYSPSDTDDVGAYFQAEGTCDPGSYAQVQLSTPSSGTIQCGYLPLDGSVNLISCANFPRGSAPAGGYEFQVLIFPPGSGGYSYVDINIVHVQQTDFAATPVQTVTVTPTDTETDTITTTSTDTFTSSQVTLTSPAASLTNTVTITPSQTQTTTTTITETFLFVIPKFTQIRTTVTKTASCSQAHFQPCQSKPTSGPKAGSKHNSFRLARRNPLVKRDTPNQGEGIAGDGPLTTTVTPAASLATATAADTTTIITITTAAPVDASTTVVNPTPTVTSFSGTAVFSTTTTLPQKTRTRTRYAFTVGVTTTTKAVTWTQTRTTTPVCAPTHK